MKKILALILAIGVGLSMTTYIHAALPKTYKAASDWAIDFSSSVDGNALKAFDEDSGTYWHSGYKYENGQFTYKAPLPHSLTVTFPSPLPVAGTIYTPRQDASYTGVADTVVIYGSDDGKTFYKIKDDAYSYGSGYSNRSPKETLFDKTVTVKAIKFEITKSSGDFGTCAELQFIKGEGAPEDSKMAKGLISLTIDSKEAGINGKNVVLASPATIKDGTTLVPLRFVSESLGATVSWEDSTKTVTIRDIKSLIELEIGQKTVWVNNEAQSLSVPAQIINNVTMVPIRFVSEALGNDVEWEAETKKVNIYYDLTIACWGDSLTEGVGTISYPTAIETLTGIKTYNMGVGGESAMSIASRQGAYDVLAAEDVTIPASGSADIKLTTYGGGNLCAIGAGGGGYLGKWNPVFIDGVEGTLVTAIDTSVAPRITATCSFRRKTAGEPVEVKAGDKLVTSASFLKADINVIYIGANGVWSEDIQGYGNNTREDAQKLAETIKAMIKNTKNPEKYIVIGFTWGGKDRWSEVDKVFKENFGDKFVDVKSYLASEQALTDHGITPTEKDKADLTTGMVPESFRRTPEDTTHLGTAGYGVMAEMVYKRMIELGFVKAK
ncbi:MAG: stalk domain-containing protein [Bacillota bacterium]|nr:stalk domain-containing protein [Bacillota bacterium]